MSQQKYAGIGSFVLFTFLPLACSSLVTYYLYQNQSLLEGFGLWQWLLVSFFLVLACAFAICPPTFLAVVMGFFMGWTAFPFLVLINLAAIALIYGLCKVMRLEWIENWLQRDGKAKEVWTKLKANELKVVFFTKLSPLFPFAVTNLVFAMSGAKFRNILLGGFLGMIPRTLLAVYAGRETKQLEAALENPGGSQQVFIAILVFVSLAGMFYFVRKAWSE